MEVTEKNIESKKYCNTKQQEVYNTRKSKEYKPFLNQKNKESKNKLNKINKFSKKERSQQTINESNGASYKNRYEK
jgi:hypothetical protein